MRGSCRLMGMFWHMKPACRKRPRWFGTETSFKQQEQLIKTAGETAKEKRRMTKTKKAKKSGRKKPRGAKFMGEIFEKYPKVRSITWDQHEGLDGLFYVESAGVLVNGKSLDDSGKLSDQERAAVIELE